MRMNTDTLFNKAYRILNREGLDVSIDASFLLANVKVCYFSVHKISHKTYRIDSSYESPLCLLL